MAKEKIKDILTITTSIFLLIVVIGISYSAFSYSGLGQKENKLTTGAITMLYTESDNTISINNAAFPRKKILFIDCLFHTFV